MAATHWQFTSNGLALLAGAWLDEEGRLHPFVQPTLAGEPVDASNPLPVAEPVAVPLDEGGVTVTTSSTTVATANASRRVIEISNGGESGVWVHFGASAATAGEGSFLPPKSSNRWAYAGEVRAIVEEGGDSCPVGYVEW